MSYTCVQSYAWYEKQTSVIDHQTFELKYCTCIAHFSYPHDTHLHLSRQGGFGVGMPDQGVGRSAAGRKKKFGTHVPDYVGR